MFATPFLAPLCLLVKGNRMFLGAGSMVIIKDIEKGEIITCKQLLAQNSQISYLSLVADAKNNMLSLITAESDGIIKVCGRRALCSRYHGGTLLCGRTRSPQSPLHTPPCSARIVAGLSATVSTSVRLFLASLLSRSLQLLRSHHRR